MASSPFGGFIDADPAIVGLVIVAVLVAAIVFIAGRIRSHSDRHRGGT